MKKGTLVSVVSILVLLLVLAIVYFAFSKRGFVPSTVNTGNISTLNTASKGTNATKQGVVSPDKTPQGVVSLAKSPEKSPSSGVSLAKSPEKSPPSGVSLAKSPEKTPPSGVSLAKSPEKSPPSVVSLAKPSDKSPQGGVSLTKSSDQASKKDIERLTKHSAIASYINKRHRLPPFYIQRGKAFQLGWDPKKRNLCDVAPGKAIGGDRYNRHDHKLPQKPNRTWFEANVDYQCGQGSKAKLIYSSDGLVYLTDNQYKRFNRIY
ncbi:ribonuclease domain-containing protein [Xenorhabdus anantnagensis]|uniref:Ribonuclease domain-containing protein n=1 Tax=Xenorhabdus anantnagensis TaxID=3025875 RepID=A0ABT5LN38_9GAMM|nr:ribonuclease domain-containing protein [Xenorhabdus anantnagensis]MDC9595837.1 ribonuclease domain-containing protein [Xenorhabdus anantnagensis]